jgi:MFS family permease
MRHTAAVVFVLLGGFAIMVLEIAGARFLARDFGGSFYVWVSQIGVILAALAAGYYVGGALADHFKRAAVLAWLLIPAGLFTAMIPGFAGRVTAAIVLRHPADEPVPLWWQKLDPALGSALIFFLPCLVLAMLAPCMVRLASRRLTEVGRITGRIYAASTVGSIAGVFISGYVLIDHFGLTTIFRGTGVLTVGLGVASLFMDRWLPPIAITSQHEP